MKRLLLACWLLLPSLTLAADNLQGLVQMLDYVGVDYPEAVSAGTVVNEAEYAEMKDFSAGIKAQISGMTAGPEKERLTAMSRVLAGMIDARAEVAEVASQVARMRREILTHFDLSVVPGKVPDMQQARAAYARHCVACHGAEGRGDGELAAALEPAPTNFHDYERHAQRTLYGLYNTITLGVDETAMAGFSQLPEDERWALAFYVGQMAARAGDNKHGAVLWQKQAGHSPLADLKTVTTSTPSEMKQEYGFDGVALLSYLRSNPDVLMGEKQQPLAFSRAKLAESLMAYNQGKREQAYQMAVTAYLEGFELAEAGLKSVAPQLLADIEQGMTNYRNAVREGGERGQLAEQVNQLTVQLNQAQQYLDSRQLSSTAAFSSALIILLREGLEAILVIAALAAFLIKTGRRDGMAYLHFGWGAALVAGFATFLVSNYVIEIGGATRELTEAIAALVAAAVLFYVGFWMHSKTSSMRWQRFIEGSVKKALSTSTLWSLAGLSFITVYREAFETILFYRALWTQTGEAGHSMMATGSAVAVAVLAVLAWLILRYSTRLPLRQFFSVTGAFLFVLAVVFAGKGVATLQEAGVIQASSLNMPAIELLGIYPNLEGLLVQALMVVAAVLLLGYSRRRSLDVS